MTSIEKLNALQVYQHSSHWRITKKISNKSYHVDWSIPARVILVQWARLFSIGSIQRSSIDIDKSIEKYRWSIQWFQSINDKHTCFFIQLDIKEIYLYPSINKDLLTTAIEFAETRATISEKKENYLPLQKVADTLQRRGLGEEIL